MNYEPFSKVSVSNGVQGPFDTLSEGVLRSHCAQGILGSFHLTKEATLYMEFHKSLPDLPISIHINPPIPSIFQALGLYIAVTYKYTYIYKYIFYDEKEKKLHGKKIKKTTG